LSFDEKRDTLIYDLAEKSLDRQWQRISDLDTKAANQIGFTGVIIGFVLGSASLLQGKLSGNWPLLAAFAVGVLTLLVSFTFGIRGFMVRTWSMGPNPVAVIRGYANESYERMVIAVGGEMAKMEQEIRLANDDKATQIRRSSLFMLAGLVLAFIFVSLAVSVG
jgi:hypothetical protein